MDFVAHNVRTKLDELKRVELDRLRKLARKAYEQENDIDTMHLKISEPEHVDHSNPHTFEIADLKKLIAKVRPITSDCCRYLLTFDQRKKIMFVHYFYLYLGHIGPRKILLRIG